MITHGTTILAVRHRGRTAVAGDGQVTLNASVIKHTARKVRRIYNDGIIVGFAGATADALSQASNVDIGSLSDFLNALRSRHEYFHQNGCRLSDHGMNRCYADFCTSKVAAAIFAKARRGTAVSPEEHGRFAAFMMLFFGQLDAAEGLIRLGDRRGSFARPVVAIADVLFRPPRHHALVNEHVFALGCWSARGTNLGPHAILVDLSPRRPRRELRRHGTGTVGQQRGTGD